VRHKMFYKQRSLRRWWPALVVFAAFIAGRASDDFSSDAASQGAPARWSSSVDQREMFGSADKDCRDFGSHDDAQTFYEENGTGDPHRLDGDGDGVACERLR
jgi:hypothetical protein